MNKFILIIFVFIAAYSYASPPEVEDSPLRTFRANVSEEELKVIISELRELNDEQLINCYDFVLYDGPAPFPEIGHSKSREDMIDDITDFEINLERTIIWLADRKKGPLSKSILKEFLGKLVIEDDNIKIKELSQILESKYTILSGFLGPDDLDSHIDDFSKQGVAILHYRHSVDGTAQELMGLTHVAFMIDRDGRPEGLKLHSYLVTTDQEEMKFQFDKNHVNPNQGFTHSRAGSYAISLERVTRENLLYSLNKYFDPQKIQTMFEKELAKQEELKTIIKKLGDLDDQQLKDCYNFVLFNSAPPIFDFGPLKSREAMIAGLTTTLSDRAKTKKWLDNIN